MVIDDEVVSTHPISVCLTDLCKALGLERRDVKDRLDKEVVSTHPLQTKGGMQET